MLSFDNLPEEFVDPNPYFVTVQEVRDAVVEYGYYTYKGIVADASGNESLVSVTFKVNGWEQDAGNWYYYNHKATKHTGWLQDGSKRYYFDLKLGQ